MDVLSLAGLLGKVLLGLVPLWLAGLAGRRGQQRDDLAQAVEVKNAQLQAAVDRPCGIDAALRLL